jgi:hypothetical protein
MAAKRNSKLSSGCHDEADSHAQPTRPLVVMERSHYLKRNAGSGPQLRNEKKPRAFAARGTFSKGTDAEPGIRRILAHVLVISILPQSRFDVCAKLHTSALANLPCSTILTFREKSRINAKFQGWRSEDLHETVIRFADRHLHCLECWLSNHFLSRSSGDGRR